MAAHAVGDDEHRRGHQEGVLVDLAHQAGVGGRAVVQLDAGHRAPHPPGAGPIALDGWPPGPPREPGFRSLADQLRSWPDERLAGLLWPVPT